MSVEGHEINSRYSISLTNFSIQLVLIITIILVLLPMQVLGSIEEDNFECLKLEEKNEIDKAMECYKNVKKKYANYYQNRETKDHAYNKLINELYEAKKFGPEYALKILENQDNLTDSLWKYKGDLLKELNRIEEAKEAYKRANQSIDNNTVIPNELDKISDSDVLNNEETPTNTDINIQDQRDRNLDPSSSPIKSEILSKDYKRTEQLDNKIQNAGIKQNRSSLIDPDIPKPTELKESVYSYEIPFEPSDNEYVSKEAYELNQKGVSSYKLGEYTNAIENFKKAIEREPKYATAWKNLAVTQNKKGNFEDAMDSYKFIIKNVDKQDAAVYNNLGYAFYKIGLKENQESDKIENMKTAVYYFDKGLETTKDKKKIEVIMHNKEIADKKIPKITDIIMEITDMIITFINENLTLIFGIVMFIFGGLLASSVYTYLISERKKRRQHRK